MVARAEVLEVLPGLRVAVATVGDLVVLKLLARDDRTRPQDAADLLALAPFLTDAERLQAEGAAALVARRGYARDRDLSALLRDYLTDHPG